MVPAQTIIDAAIEHRAVAIGLSGLITPSLEEMSHIAKEMNRQGITLPLLIGGATTSRAHTALKIAPHHQQPVIWVKDASRAVGVAAAVCAPGQHQDYLKDIAEDYAQIRLRHAQKSDAKALVAFTSSGDTVRRLARLHSRLPLLAFVTASEIRSQLALTWGAETFVVPHADTTDDMIRQVDHALLELGRYQRGDLVVIVAGAPPGTVGSTNLIHIHRIGENDH
jgi:cobalamin-dependent methionine synthase I